MRKHGGWAKASRASGYYTAEDLDAFFDEYSELLAKYGHGRHDAPPGARLMQLRMFYIPDEPAGQEPSSARRPPVAPCRTLAVISPILMRWMISRRRPMSRTVIDLDDDLVAEVARALGTRTKKDTVNTALREVLENRRRAVALTRLREAAAEGAIDLGLLDDKRNYRR